MTKEQVLRLKIGDTVQVNRLNLMETFGGYYVTKLMAEIKYVTVRKVIEDGILVNENSCIYTKEMLFCKKFIFGRS